MSNSNAPIALFLYNRPWHTRQAVEALLANAEAPETPLHIFSDAPKDISASEAVAQVRAYIREIRGFKSVSIIERETNLGLGRSIIDGVTRVCEEHGRVIVLEDDLIASPFFLAYMNDGLVRYAEDERVISIHGYVYPVGPELPETFFLKGADCWGWATWRRGWKLFEPDGKKLLTELSERGLTWKFDYDGAYPHTRMLKAQIEGKNDSWAIRWHASAYARGKLTLYPGRSLIQNIGFDNSGIHCGSNGALAAKMTDKPVRVGQIPVKEDPETRRKIVAFLYRARTRGVFRRFMDLWQRIFNGRKRQ